MELHCLVFPFQLRFGHRRDVCEMCKAKVKRQPSLSKGQWSSHTLSLIFCLTEDGVGQQQELQRLQIPMDLLLSFFKLWARWRASASLAHNYIIKWQAMSGQFVFMTYSCLCFSSASCLTFLLDCCLSWSTVTSCSHQLLSTVPTTAYNVLPIIGPLLYHLELFFLPDWTLNNREICTREGSRGTEPYENILWNGSVLSGIGYLI